jgi:tetratricopeptide (TPR) repeat protein
MEFLKFLGLILKLFMIVDRMFFTGEKIHDIKSECFSVYAWHLHEKKNYEDAVKYYNKAISLNPNNYTAYIGLTVTLLEKNQFTLAKVYCQKADSIRADGTTIIFMFIIYESLGETTSAAESMQKILQQYVGNVALAYNQVSYAYFNLGMHQKAEYHCKEALKIRPNEGAIHYNLANIYLAQERLNEAKDEFKKAISLTSDKRYLRFARKKMTRINKITLES